MVLDARDPKQPRPLSFARTMGWVTHISFSKNTADLAAGHYGIFEVDLNAATVG